MIYKVVVKDTILLMNKNLMIVATSANEVEMSVAKSYPNYKIISVEEMPEDISINEV